MPIDLQYLLWLQALRAATGGIFDEFFNGLSKFAVEIMPFLPLLVGIGLGLLYGWKYYFANATIILLLGKHWGNLLARFILTFFAVVIWPLVIRRFCADGTDEKERNNGT